MSLVTRFNKGSKLSIDEMDNNLLYLEKLSLGNDLPKNFFFAGSANTTSSSTRAQLNYITDELRSIDMRNFLADANKGDGVLDDGFYVHINDVNEVLRDGNNIYAIGRIVAGYTVNPNFILRMECRIIDNILVVINSDYNILDSGLSTPTSVVKFHGSYLSDGWIYLSTRPTNTTGDKARILKINSLNLSDIKTFIIPISESIGSINEIKLYKDKIYFLCDSTTPQSTKLFSLDKNLNVFTLIATYNNILKTITTSPSFAIYDDKIYTSYFDNTSSSTRNRYIGILEISLTGVILRSSELYDLGINTSQAVAHWSSIFNGKLIINASLNTPTNKKLLRWDIYTLQMEEVISPNEGITDDNTLMSDGTIYLSSEGNNNGSLFKMNYKDFTTLTIYATGWRSAGAVQYYYF